MEDNDLTRRDMLKLGAAAAAAGALSVSAPLAAQTESQPAKKAPADPLDGPPFVTAKAWAVGDANTGARAVLFSRSAPPSGAQGLKDISTKKDNQ